MSINQHTFWHTIRTVSTGLFVVGLIPLPFIFFGPRESVAAYLTYMAVSVAGIILGLMMTIKYRKSANHTTSKKAKEKVYGIIGISLIALAGLAVVAIAIIGSAASGNA